MNKVTMKWKGSNGTFWCLMAYWIGSGYQYAEREITEECFDQLTIS